MISRERAIDRRPMLRTVAVVPLSAQVPVKPFVDALAGALGRFGSARSVGRTEADDALRDDSGWLNRLEEQFRFVVYQADTHVTEWTERCIR
jgi:hypothetical protein